MTASWKGVGRVQFTFLQSEHSSCSNSLSVSCLSKTRSLLTDNREISGLYCKAASVIKSTSPTKEACSEFYLQETRNTMFGLFGCKRCDREVFVRNVTWQLCIHVCSPYAHMCMCKHTCIMHFVLLVCPYYACRWHSRSTLNWHLAQTAMNETLIRLSSWPFPHLMSKTLLNNVISGVIIC